MSTLMNSETAAPELSEAAEPSSLVHPPHSDATPALDESLDPKAEAGEATTWREARQARIDEGLDWPIFGWIAALHLGALAGFFTFTWQGLLVAVFLAWLTGSLGICLGFHRLFTHRSFKTHKASRWFFAWLGGLAGEGSAIHWVANHRKHHAYSDRVGDPHSPLDGPWWSHVTWVLWARQDDAYHAYNRRWAPDLAEDRVLLFLDKTFIYWHLLLGAVLFGAGYLLGGFAMAASFVVWGMFVRLVYVLHSTWLVNSASHMWGYRTYDCNDDSRNNWWVALLTFGEGWHNNHHAFPSMARAGHKWWEIDTTFWVIRTMSWVGLAWDVVDGHHKKTDKRNAAPGPHRAASERVDHASSGSATKR